MSKDEPFAGAQIYVGLDYDGDLTIAWKSEADVLSVYIPRGYQEKTFKFDLSEWPEQRESYRKSDEDFDQYDDLVNAAWHLIGQRGRFLNRSTFMLSNCSPGKYFSRIWRGNYQPERFDSGSLISPAKVYGQYYTQSIVAAASLFDYLLTIFKNVEPSRENNAAFGHRSRELLILACTEIESGWRAVLEQNSAVKKRQYSTADYVKVLEPLRLTDWTVYLTDYPNMEAFAPFKNWSQSRPTQSLEWYAAYNLVKHHREAEFARANLSNVLNAMAALYVMQIAQWGPGTYHPLMGGRSSPFSISSFPTFALSDLYLPKVDGSDHADAMMYFDTHK